MTFTPRETQELGDAERRHARPRPWWGWSRQEHQMLDPVATVVGGLCWTVGGQALITWGHAGMPHRWPALALVALLLGVGMGLPPALAEESRRGRFLVEHREWAWVVWVAAFVVVAVPALPLAVFLERALS